MKAKEQTANIWKLMTILIIQYRFIIRADPMEQDIIIKFCVVGEPSVGKTSMLYQYVHHKFDEKVRPTIGCDFSTKLNSSLDGKPVRLQLWDIAGQQRFNAVSKMYLRGALGCVIVCSASDRATLEQTIKWKRIIMENADNGGDLDVPCLLVQNKSDLINNEQPESHQTKKHLEEFARNNNFCGYMQCSAKDNKNIDQIFQTLLDQTIKRGLVKGTASMTQKSRITAGSKGDKVDKNQSSNIKLTAQNMEKGKKQKKKCC